MIFIPTGSVRKYKNDNNSEWLYWDYNNDVVIVMFVYKKDLHYSYIEEVNSGNELFRFSVQRCAELSCDCKPQLRYNKILKKYFCTCPSSMLDVKNTDEDEIRHFKESNIRITEANGFTNDPLIAIALWTKHNAQAQVIIANDTIKAIKGKRNGHH